MYEIIYSDSALKQLDKLNNQTRERIINAVERLRMRPYEYNLKKLVGITGYRLRVGDYRVILDIDNNKLIILVLKVGHRKNIYDS
jgi:mRNA interferase RelE/StbE